MHNQFNQLKGTVETALQRETWEEAGLQACVPLNLQHGGWLLTRRPYNKGNGTGYGVKDIDGYCCTVPEGVTPVNQNGEVAQFALISGEALLRAMQRGEFTMEAALIFAEVLELGSVI